MMVGRLGGGLYSFLKAVYCRWGSEYTGKVVSNGASGKAVLRWWIWWISL